MFPTLPFIIRQPQKYVSASIAHELAHIIYCKNLNNSNIKTYLKEGYLSQDIIKEKDATAYYNQFKDPIYSLLLEWDSVKNGKENEEQSDLDIRPFKIKTVEMESLMKEDRKALLSS